MRTLCIQYIVRTCSIMADKYVEMYMIAAGVLPVRTGVYICNIKMFYYENGVP